MSNLISDYTWKELEKIYQSGCTVLVPVGSNEQHGPHMPVNTDSFYVTQVCEKVIQKLKDKMPIYRTPTVWVGYSPHHRNFPGTLTLRMETFMSLIYDICDGLIRHKVRRVVLVNGHGGNGAPLRVIGSKIGDDTGNSPYVFSYWEVLKREMDEVAAIVQEGQAGIPGHAGELETSFRKYLAPDTIREKDLAEAEFITEDPNPHDANIYQYSKWEDVSYKGYTGHPKWANAEKGEKVFNMIIDKIVKVLDADYSEWKKSTK